MASSLIRLIVACKAKFSGGHLGVFRCGRSTSPKASCKESGSKLQYTRMIHFSAKMRQRYGLSAALHRVSGHQTRPTSIDPQPLRQHYSCIICYPQQYLKEYRTPPSRDESRSPALPALRNAASPRPAKDGHTQVINSNLTWISQPAKALESGYTGLCSGVLCRLHY